MPIPRRRSSQPHGMPRQAVRGIRPSFPGLSPCGGQVAYVLLTSAPVAIGSVATPMLPLDLHVLSLSLAFILSQDQTLRCCVLSFFSLSRILGRDTPSCLPRSGSRRSSLCCVVELNGDISMSLVLLYYVLFLCSISRISPRPRPPQGAKAVAKLLPPAHMDKFSGHFFCQKNIEKSQTNGKQMIVKC